MNRLNETLASVVSAAGAADVPRIRQDRERPGAGALTYAAQPL